MFIQMSLIPGGHRLLNVSLIIIHPSYGVRAGQIHKLMSLILVEYRLYQFLENSAITGTGKAKVSVPSTGYCQSYEVGDL